MFTVELSYSGSQRFLSSEWGIFGDMFGNGLDTPLCCWFGRAVWGASVPDVFLFIYLELCEYEEITSSPTQRALERESRN